MGNPNVDFLPFAVPLEITAGEEILLGNTGFITNPTAANTGVGFEQILLTVTGDLPTPAPPAIPEPSSIAVLGLGGFPSSPWLKIALSDTRWVNQRDSKRQKPRADFSCFFYWYAGGDEHASVQLNIESGKANIQWK